ncbi:M48 family peptidase [Marinilabiliaceae bacterium JC017]|nr:M48 family peptidase [Marinilabiliaceae bacterium JC017]
MTGENMFWVVIAILIGQYVFEQFLEFMNRSRWQSTLPKELDGLYDESEYEKHMLYKKANFSFDFLSETFSLVLILAVLFFGGFAWLSEWVCGITDGIIWQSLLFFGTLGLASEIINLPFGIYGTFVIEEKFGFNKTTPKIFVLDHIKSLVLSALIGAPILGLIVWFYALTGPMFWVYAWMLASGFMIFMTMFYTSLILPLFNKQTPLEAGELRSQIEAFSNKVGFKLDNIFVMDGSKRSTKANAFFSGLGKRKRIVLYDTLVNDLENEEIVAVLAHEIGHYKLKHTLLGTVMGLLQTGLLLFLFSLVVDSPLLSQALGVEQPNFFIGMLAFGLLYTPVSLVLGTFMSWVSRKNEYGADAFAGKYSSARALGEALKKISVKALSNLTPHPWYVFFHYSHPPLLARLKALKVK